MLWLKSLTPLGKGIGAFVLIALILGSIFLFLRFSERQEAKDDAVLVNSGVVQERAATQGEALKNVEKARDATERATDAERNSVCAKYDRNCQNGQ